MRRLAGAAAAALLLAACGEEPDRPGFAYMPEMFSSVPVDGGSAFAPGPSGQGLWLPPEGTVPVGYEPFPYGGGPEEAQRAGLELSAPGAPTEADLARGKKVYESTCFVCHGTRGEGDGPIVGRFPNPPSLLAEKARSLPEGRVLHILMRGQGIMPSHAAQVPPEDRWRVVWYVKSLQAAAAGAAVGAAPAPEAAPAPAVAPAAPAGEARP